MDVTRRDFLKISGAATAGLMLGSVFDLMPIKAYATANPPEWDTVVASICPYCGCGCGVLVGSDSGGLITYVQGDPDHPINQGALCSKGAASVQLCTVDGQVNPERVQQPLRRSPGSSTWTPIDWNTAMTEIAGLIKAEREANLQKMGDAGVGEDESTYVNRLETIAALGTAKDTNEECYLFTKLMRALGIVYLEHCARV
ncbi:MAG: twin-arginine translocation signal domain-containing protein [Desulfobacterales bacterium]|nr:twin-arginine translocation signal domain-containing protein [Desulfobacterales bacterium]